MPLHRSSTLQHQVQAVLLLLLLSHMSKAHSAPVTACPPPGCSITARAPVAQNRAQDLGFRVEGWGEAGVRFESSSPP